MLDNLDRTGRRRRKLFTGVLAVVVASPCTAPFMGTALGYALTQPIVVTLIVFAALGAGMALPMVILSHSSAAVRALPKPGPWMDTAKNVLAFPLYLTSVWLLWVAGNQAGVNTMALALSGLVLLALAAYLYGDTKLRKGSALSLSLALFSLQYRRKKGGGSDSSRTLSEGQIAWSASVLDDYIERGDPFSLMSQPTGVLPALRTRLRYSSHQRWSRPSSMQIFPT